jgi:hypothetical protein
MPLFHAAPHRAPAARHRQPAGRLDFSMEGWFSNIAEARYGIPRRVRRPSQCTAARYPSSANRPNSPLPGRQRRRWAMSGHLSMTAARHEAFALFGVQRTITATSVAGSPATVFSERLSHGIASDEAGLFPDCLFQILRGAEGDLLLCRDLDGLTGCWIAAFACGVLTDLEAAEAGDPNAVALL